MDESIFIIKNLHNALLTGLAGLTKLSPDTGVVFPIVSKYLYDIPENGPALYLQAGGLESTDFSNLSFDEMRVSFTAYLFEMMENVSSQENMDLKVDRLNDAVMYIYRYLGKIPNNLGVVAGIQQIYRSQFESSIPSDVRTPGGQGIQIAVNFSLYVSVDVKLITS